MVYLALVHKDPNSDFGVSFPDFLGCVTGGRSLEEAKAMAVEALHGHIAAMQAAGLAVPDPSPLGVIMQHADYPDSLALLPVEVAPAKAAA